MKGVDFSGMTYGIIVEDEGVLVFVEVVEGALRDAVLDLDRALDVLLIGHLHLAVVALLVVPLGRGQPLHHHALLIVSALELVLLVAGATRRDLFVERKGFILLVAHA